MKKADNPLKKREIVFVDGHRGLSGDFPIAVIYTQVDRYSNEGILVVDPILTSAISRNLYGRVMTLIEATTDPQRLKAVKDVFSKELGDWMDKVYRDAREIARGGNHSENLYNK